MTMLYSSTGQCRQCKLHTFRVLHQFFLRKIHFFAVTRFLDLCGDGDHSDGGDGDVGVGDDGDSTIGS